MKSLAIIVGKAVYPPFVLILLISLGSLLLVVEWWNLKPCQVSSSGVYGRSNRSGRISPKEKHKRKTLPKAFRLY